MRWTLLLALSLAAAAAAQTNVPTVTCDSQPNPIYVAGSTAVRPFMGVVAQLLGQESPPYTVVYQGLGSCVGVNGILNGAPIVDVPAVPPSNLPDGGTVPGKAANYAIFFHTADGSAQECYLRDGGTPLDVGVSDVYATSCGYVLPDAGVGNYEGPIQPMTFVVPSASSQRSISAEAAYEIFGTGGNGGTAAPWTDPTLYLVRNKSSGTQTMLGLAINVPAAQWWGIDRGSSGAVQQGMLALTDPTAAEKAIGIVSVDIADEQRSNMRVLAFQGYGQSCGYLADSTPFAEDKANVRDGHYPVWGPVHFYARTTNSIPSPAAADLVTRFSAVRLDQSLLTTIIKGHLVPKCAMNVQRTSEMGPLSPYQTDARCSCYFDSLANGGTTCQACNGPADCPSDHPACNYGYCETAN
jgi:hypothetical protein